MSSHANGLKDSRTEENTKLSEKIDALEVRVFFQLCFEIFIID